MNTTTPAYVPGVCNINPKEIANRRNVGHAGTAIFAVLFIAITVLGLTSYLKIALFLPALLAAAGYLQAKEHFCVGYAAAGQHNAEDGSTKAETITDKAALAIDKLKTTKMYRQMFLYAAIATIIAVAVPPYHF